MVRSSELGLRARALRIYEYLFVSYMYNSMHISMLTKSKIFMYMDIHMHIYKYMHVYIHICIHIHPYIYIFAKSESSIPPSYPHMVGV